MAYKVIILYQLYMPSYFLGTFTEYPYLYWRKNSSVSKSKGGHPQLQPKLGHFSHSSMKRASSRKRSMYSSTPISAVKYSIVYSVVTTVLL